MIDTIQYRFGKTDAEILFCIYILDMRREEVASHLDISVKRLHKILDGHKGRPGLRSELDRHIAVIESGGWCEEHRSLINAYVLGWFGPENQKARQARAHLAACSACRSVANAKLGIAVLLPPLTPAFFHADRASSWLDQFIAGVHSLARTIGEKFGFASTPDAATGAGAAVGSGTVAVGGIAGAKIAACLSVALVGGAACIAAVTFGDLDLGTSQARGTAHAARHVQPAVVPPASTTLTVASPLPKAASDEGVTRRAQQHSRHRAGNDEFTIEKTDPTPQEQQAAQPAPSTPTAPAAEPAAPEPTQQSPPLEFSPER